MDADERAAGATAAVLDAVGAALGSGAGSAAVDAAWHEARSRGATAAAGSGDRAAARVRFRLVAGAHLPTALVEDLLAAVDRADHGAVRMILDGGPRLPADEQERHIRLG